MKGISIARVLPLLAVLSAAPVWAMSDDAARDLLRRSGFQPQATEVEPLLKLSQAKAVDRLVDAAADQHRAVTPAPDWVDDPLPIPAEMKQLSEDERRETRRLWGRRSRELQAWWMSELIATPSPLAERMTLFWHGHFTSSLKAVKAPQLLYRQNQLLRAQALGNYRDLLHAIARDPAMLVYLNNQQNRKGQPNENFARELLELFTLGEGHYSEQDIKEAARAFTGWKMQPPEGRFIVVAKQHDEGEKRFMNQRGNFDGDDIIDIILQQPRAAEFIVEELWREFVSPQPDAAVVKQLAVNFRKNWELAPLMKALLREPALYAASNEGALVKSPVEYVVGTVRALDLPLSPVSAALATEDMGQGLFDPPNVKGWPSGSDWINGQWLLARRQFVMAMAGDAPALEMDDEDMDAGKRRARMADRQLRRQAAVLQRRFGEAAEALPVTGADKQLLVLAPVMPPVEGAKPPDRLLTWLLDPVYNLK